MKEITREDEELMEKVKGEWLDTVKKPLNKELVTEGIRFIQEYGNLPKGEIVFCDSPDDATLLANAYFDRWLKKERETKGPDFDPERDLSFSTHARVSDLGWVSFYDFFEQRGVLDDADFKNYKKVFYGGMFDSIQTDLAWFIVPNPKKIYRNEEGQVHREDGPAVEWEDGSGRYYLNNTPVRKELVMTPATQLSLDMYTEISNADERTEFVRKYGIDRMVGMGKVVDTYSNYTDPWYIKSEYELVDMACLFETIDYAPHLKMKHQTMPIYVVEPVSPDVRTIEEALSDRLEEDVTQLQIKDIK